MFFKKLILIYTSLATCCLASLFYALTYLSANRKLFTKYNLISRSKIYISLKSYIWYDSEIAKSLATYFLIEIIFENIVASKYYYLNN